MPNGRVLVAIASRDRPHLLESAIRSILMSSEKADVAYYVDDDQASEYDLPPNNRVLRMSGPQVGPCRSLQSLVDAHPGYEVYGAATDDCSFITPGWDRWALKAAKRQPISVICPYHQGPLPDGVDLEAQAVLPRLDFPFATAEWIRRVGYFAHPATYCVYWDVIMEVWGEMTTIVRAGRHDFEILHDWAPSANQGKFLADAKAAILVLAHETRDAVDRIENRKPRTGKRMGWLRRWAR